MESAIPDLSEKMEKDQEECADALAEAFLGKVQKVPQTYIEALKELVADKEEKERLKLELDRSRDWYSIKSVWEKAYPTYLNRKPLILPENP